MSSSETKATLRAKLGLDAIHSTLDNGTAVYNIRLPTYERYKGSSTGGAKGGDGVAQRGTLRQAC
ncbi:ssb [Candidatus Tremblaya princeps]|uniref:Ssb protein n=1 Tax=Tremblaya princeps TaxID=189385 RepID=A0A143WP87_TREPR|nr:ssb [Candidatus Tremblaya princeps]